MQKLMQKLEHKGDTVTPYEFVSIFMNVFP